MILFRRNPGFLASLLVLGLVRGTIGGERRLVSVPSSLDGSEQPCYVILPKGYDPDAGEVPLLVALHSWSGDVQQRKAPLEEAVEQAGWIYLFPHFRGPNQHPDACGSVKAQQDILDAVKWACDTFPIDRCRIYLTGSSGGGHMTMLMAGRHPDIWAAASAWVGISDLAAWHHRHATDRYGAMLRKSCGGAPGDSPEVDRQYRERSPLTHLDAAKDLPLDIAAGVHDGHRGSVPIRHSLDAFNVIARANGGKVITEEEILQLSRKDGRLEKSLACDTVEDSSFGRPIYLRRTAGKARVTIFEGGHESVAAASVEWLRRHKKSVQE